MGRRDIRERKCGCLYFQIGPPVLCPKHEKKIRVKEEKGLRKLVAEKATELGHQLSDFTEYDSQPGKWTAYCHECGLLAIVYDTPPAGLDQINAKILTKKCERGVWRDGKKAT